MPLTFCHPAIVLPLKKINPNWFSMTGLIIGSMSPDLEYFSRMKIEATHSHLFFGVLYFDLPLALVYCFVFHMLVRNCILHHLPNYFQQRFVQFLKFDWISYLRRNWLIVIASVIIGGYSHLLWDAFTHEWGYFAKQIPALQEVWFTHPVEVKGYKFLQHFSTFIGGVFILNWIHFMPKEGIQKTEFDSSFWLQLFGYTFLISLIRLVIFPVEVVLGNIIVVVGMSIFLSLIVLGVKDKLFKK
ncbi:DUF4184 family protein [Empedobacter brevis]